MNNPGKIFLLLSALFPAALILGAGEMDERKLGDRAFFADDYLTAVSHYRSAQKLSPEDNVLSQAWSENTLRLGRAQLFAGDLQGAKQTLKEFRRRHPLRSAGTLPADILVAEGKYAEAEKLYLAMEENPGDGQHINAAKFGRGTMLLKQGKFKDAEAVFKELTQNDSPVRQAAQRELAYTLIRSQRPGEAAKLLAQVPEKERGLAYETVSALAEINSGKSDNFKKVWKSLFTRQLRQPDARSYELLTSAAMLAEKQNDLDFCIDLLKTAEPFAPTTEARQDILKRLINLQSKSDPDGAAETAWKYGELFPQSSDRFDVQLSAGSILADAQKFFAAANLFDKLVSAGNIPQNIRFQAAIQGALFAESAGNADLAVKLFQSAGESATTPEALLKCRRQYAEFLIRRQDHPGAIAVLQQAVGQNLTPENQILWFMLLDAAVKVQDRPTIIKSSEQLKKSDNPLFKGRGFYEAGSVAAAVGNFAAARKDFLSAAAVKDAGQYAVSGSFGAALMAFNLGDYKSAGNESLLLATSHPEMQYAPQALFLGYRSARMSDDGELKKKCAAILTDKYADSESYAVYALQNAQDRADSERDISGAIHDLEELERRFAKDPAIVTEAMLMRAEMLKISGKKQDALECAGALLTQYPQSRAAYNAAMLAGELNILNKNFPEALKFFNQAGNLRTPGLEQELARFREAELMLRMSISQTKMREEAIANAEKLIGTFTFPALRMKMRYFRAWALEHYGNLTDALQGYEQLLNEAVELQSKAIPADLNYCVKGATAALQIINSGNRRSQHIRGLRLIRQCRILQLQKYGFDADALQNEIIKKLSHKTKRR